MRHCHTNTAKGKYTVQVYLPFVLKERREKIYVKISCFRDWGCGGFMHKKEVITKRRPPQQKGGIISLKI